MAVQGSLALIVVSEYVESFRSTPECSSLPSGNKSVRQQCQRRAHVSLEIRIGNPQQIEIRAATEMLYGVEE